MGPSPSLAKYFKDYSSFHKTKGNRITHYFGIPMIVMSLFGLLSLWDAPNALIEAYWSSPFLHLDGGTIVILLGMIWYAFLDWKISGAFIFVLMGFYFLGRAIPTPMNLGLFVLGWILQGIGHAVFEKKSPAFLKNIEHLLIGPLWIFCKLVGYR